MTFFLEPFLQQSFLSLPDFTAAHLASLQCSQFPHLPSIQVSAQLAHLHFLFIFVTQQVVAIAMLEFAKDGAAKPINKPSKAMINGFFILIILFVLTFTIGVVNIVMNFNPDKELASNVDE